MTTADWKRLSGFVAALWPGSPWEPNTVEAGWFVCGELEFDITQKVVVTISQSGVRYAPTPGDVYAKVQEQIEASTPALPPPDAIRDLTQEEIKRVERWRPRLQQVMAELAERRAMRYDSLDPALDPAVLEGEASEASGEEPKALPPPREATG